jgi:hypothetical protein
MIVGGISVTAGMLWLTRLTIDSHYLSGVVGPLVLFGLGAGMIFIPLTGRALAGVQPENAGAASGLLNVLQQVGGALGLGILVTIFGTASRSSIAGGGSANPTERAREVLTDGVHAAFIGSAIYAALTLTVIILGVRPWVRRNPAPAKTIDPATIEDAVLDTHV